MLFPQFRLSLDASINETEALREDFGQSLTQLKQMQAKLMQENDEHAQRAEVLMKKTRKGLVEIQMEERISQLESSIESNSDLFKQREGIFENRMSEMAAVMSKRDRQADERWNSCRKLMHRRDIDVDMRMVDHLTTVQDLILGVKAVVKQTAAVVVFICAAGI